MNLLLFDTPGRDKLFPLTYTRAVADIRIGILTIKERWEKALARDAFILTEEYLQPLYTAIAPSSYLVVDPTLLSTKIFDQVQELNEGEGLFDEYGLVAVKIFLSAPPLFSFDFSSLVSKRREIETVKRLEHPYQLFQLNEEFLAFDYQLLTEGKTSNDTVLLSSNTVNPSNIFIEEGATINFSTLNASTGPIYIGKDATIMEGCLIRGPFAMGEGSVLKMGTKIYGATTLGPLCVAGGELKNVVMFGYSNKAHDGYVGDSVIGEWCNFGAGTSNSNVKNTASEVKVWDYSTQQYIDAGIKCGLIMGDYSRTAINTSINTGTAIGVCCNILSDGLTKKVIPNFTWNAKELSRYELSKAIRDIHNWKNFKGKRFLSSEVEVVRYIFDHFND